MAEEALTDTGVLVVGAGPTGLLLASELHRRGVPCRLIDANPGPLHWDRTTVVHPRTLEIFESLGLAGKLLDVGAPQRGARVHSGGEVLGAFDLTTSGSSYPFSLGVSEEVTESVLTDYLHDQGGEVVRAARLVSLTAHDDGVQAEITHDDGGHHEIEASWVVGCDGIHSPTRESTGITLEGHDIDAPWAVFDTTLDGWDDVYDVTFVYLEATPVIMTALPDRRWHVYLRPTSGESDLVADTAATLGRYAPGVTFADVENPTRFHCHSKVATSYRAGRVLLAGDAAHLCSPAQGHGMNTGLHDAANLAWKLALVYHGDADAALLDSYEAERRPIAELVAREGEDFEHAQTVTDPAERESRDRSFRTTLAEPASRHHEIVAEAELDVDCCGSPIVAGDDDDRLGPGQRIPDTIAIELADGGPARLHQLTHHAGHTLLLLGGPRADGGALADLLVDLRHHAGTSPLVDAVVALGTGPDLPEPIGHLPLAAAELLGVGGTTLLAVRPDGYVGLRADQDHLPALERYDALVRRGHA